VKTNEAASRILKAVQAENIYLSQFSTFGDLDRSESFFKEYSDTLWNKQRLSQWDFML
jgi:hypothetical protein